VKTALRLIKASAAGVSICFVLGFVCAQELDVDVDPLLSMNQVEDLRDGTTLGAADISRARPVNAMTISMLKDFEGWRPDHYNDSSSYCTIGYGHLIALKRCEEINLGRFAKAISPAEGESLLASDLLSARVAVTTLLNPDIDVGDDQFGALVSFTFNLGKDRLRNSTLLKLVNEGSFDAAALQFSRWSGARNKKTGKIERVEGLATRRACEVALFKGQMTGATFNRSDCAPLGFAGPGPDLIDVLKGEQ
jgi:lysozyme